VFGGANFAEKVVAGLKNFGPRVPEYGICMLTGRGGHERRALDGRSPFGVLWNSMSLSSLAEWLEVRE
jgi:hypothetical protein